jgi:hypothetical protein
VIACGIGWRGSARQWDVAAGWPDGRHLRRDVRSILGRVTSLFASFREPPTVSSALLPLRLLLFPGAASSE